MEAALTTLAGLGLPGAIIVILVYDIFVLQKRLLTIIETNTAAMTELKASIDAICKK